MLTMFTNRNMLRTEVEKDHGNKGDIFNLDDFKSAFLHVLYLVLITSYGMMKWINRLSLQILHNFSKIINIYKKPDGKKILGNTVLSKVPLHVAYVIHDTETDYNSLTDLVQWSLLLGVKFVSVVVDSRNFDDNSFERTVKSCLSDSMKNKCKFHVHNYCEKRCLPVNIIRTSVKKTRQQFISTVKRICSSNDSDPSRLNLNALHEHFCEVDCGLPDPELLISFGEYYSYFGFKPWHLRLTEIIHCASLTSLSPNLFMKWFITYSSCQQRLGS